MDNIKDIIEKAISKTEKEDVKILLKEALYAEIDGEIRYKLIDMVKSDQWPEAVPNYLICLDTEEDKTDRAEGILEYIETPIANKKFLDFGCGEGHVALKASKDANKSVGYDIEKTGNLNWEQEGNCLLTTKLENLKTHAPYDIILLYDVLDHCKDPEEVLNQVKNLCDEKTEVYIRFHGFMSRHGTHLYKQINKAWAHIYLNEKEIEHMGLKETYARKVYFPIKEQEELIFKCGFKKTKEKIVHCNVENYFQNPYLKKIQPKCYDSNSAPVWQMSQTFNDYIIKLSG
jgi:2-polyprenyl-3-methyl-5-hydroxy-6-metoxy-1,4-benzoquinol methylase